MARVCLVMNRHNHQRASANTLAAGFQRHGIAVAEGNPRQGDLVVCWGWRVGQRYRQLGLNVLVVERGYLGDRFHWTSLALNGLNGRGHFPGVEHCGPERFNQHFADQLVEWDPVGDYVLICGQVPGDAALAGKDLRPWYDSKAAEHVRAGQQVFFRPHPLAARRGPPHTIRGIPTLEGDLGAALKSAKLVVTYNSNTGIDALLAGKPVSVADQGSMAYAWDGTDQGRVALLQRIACCQWQPEEVASGTALEGFLPFLGTHQEKSA